MRKFLIPLVSLVLITSCSGFMEGVKRPVHEVYDSEFLYWCMGEGIWSVHGELPVDCAPEDVSRGDWGHYPILVNAEGELESETIIAIDSFNDQVGFELFRYQAGNMEPEIGIITAGSKPWVAAEAKHISMDGVHRGGVLVYNGVEFKDREDIMLHELGHLVGLKHDHDNKHSIMFPTVAYRVARLEPQDIKALRRVYLE